jgi:hypothetical protein
VKVESSIRSDFKEGVVVWRMVPEVAVFYAEELRRIQGDDAGIKADADELNGCAAALEDAEL